MPINLSPLPINLRSRSRFMGKAAVNWLDTKTLGTELDWCYLPHYEPLDAKDFLWKPLPRYSTAMAAAWLVVEKLKTRTPERDWRVEVWAFTGKNGKDRYTCGVYWIEEDDLAIALEYADTAPLAICRAALKAIAKSAQPILPT